MSQLYLDEQSGLLVTNRSSYPKEEPFALTAASGDAKTEGERWAAVFWDTRTAKEVVCGIQSSILGSSHS